MSSEDEKLPQSPSTLEVVPEKIEEIVSPKSPDEEPHPDETAKPETPETSVNHIHEGPEPLEEPIKVPTQEAKDDDRTLEDSEEVKDKVEPSPDGEEEPGTVTVPRENDAVVKKEPEPEEPASEEPDVQAALSEENISPSTSPVTEPEKTNLMDEKSPESPTKARFVKKDPRRESSSENNSLDLNLSISSFLGKSREAGSVSIKVRVNYTDSRCVNVCNRPATCSGSNLCTRRLYPALIFFPHRIRNEKRKP